MAVEQMKDLGLKCVLLGHSERRGEFGLPTPAESSELLATKLAYLLEKGIKVILAIGEPLPIREKGLEATIAYCAEQLKPCLPSLDPATVVIAYEPVWAIGTGEVATGDDAQEVCAAIRRDIEQRLGASCAESVRILYGGSVKAANAAGIMSQPEVDGCLVGGASLDPDEFIGIVRYRLHPEMLA